MVQSTRSRFQASGPLHSKTLKFSIRIVRLFQFLTKDKKEYILSKQVLRSGTNPGAMVREASNAESPKDFIHKLGIAQKEIAETQYWLELLHATDYLSQKEFHSLYSDSTQILKMLKSSIQTKKANLHKDKSMK